MLNIMFALLTLTANAQPICSIEGTNELEATSIQLLQKAIYSVQCGDSLSALRYSRLAAATIKQSATPRGSCYDKRKCTGSTIGTFTVEKSTCNAAGGKSWRQETPTQGPCENI